MAATAGLAACGNGYEAGPVAVVAAGVVPGLARVVGDPAAATAPADGFGPEDIAADPTGFVIMGVPGLNQPTLARRVAGGQAGTTWISQDGYTAAFRDGMLVATRGLGFDLMAADPAAARAALAAGGGTYSRVHETLDSLDRIVRTEFDCTMQAQGREEIDLGLRQVVARKFSETCGSRAIRFENLYWLDNDGGILSSRQFISRTVAYLRSNRI